MQRPIKPGSAEGTGAGSVTAPEISGRQALYGSALLISFCLLVLLFDLGAAALFEPDEGRNAEVAREMLLLGNWVIPHYDFIPYLDKPVFFYWLVAISYKLFGVSEWSARLPSAVSALGTLTLVYLFARRFFGIWQALWATLILLTSVGFYGMSRIVIFDMPLTFFVTLGLLSFFWSQSAVTEKERKLACLVFYASLGAATLVKGAIGVFLPGMVLFFYFLVTRKRFLLRRMELPLGMALFLVIVVPWYLWAELRSPGYLRYFLYEEHVLRFMTSQFKRSGPWYFYIPVLALGFFPWTLILPAMVRGARRSLRNHLGLFLLLWAVVPFVFFSLSNSKLPHYILPIFPPLALIGGVAVEACLMDPEKKRWPLWIPALGLVVVVIACAAALYAPGLFPHQWSELLETAPAGPAGHQALALTLVGALAAAAIYLGFRDGRQSLYLVTAVAFFLVLVVGGPIASAVSRVRSSKEMAQKAAPFIAPGTGLVIYDAYLSSLPFYLRLEQPLMVVWSGTKSSVLGSAFMAEKKPAPANGYPKVLFTYEEFGELWRDRSRPLLVFLHPSVLHRFPGVDEGGFEPMAQVGDVILIGNRSLSPARAAVKAASR